MNNLLETQWYDRLFSPWEARFERSALGDTSPTLQHILTQGAPGVANWSIPLQWDLKAQQAGSRIRVLCATALDIFDAEVPQQWREELFDLMEQTPSIDWLICTEKVKNAKLMVPPGWMQKHVVHDDHGKPVYEGGWPRNVWIGVNVSEQVQVDRLAIALLALPAPVHFLRVTPLSRVSIGEFLQFESPHCESFVGSDSTEDGYCSLCHGHETDPIHVSPAGRISWVIAGGQSGQGAQPSSPEWMVSLRDECNKAQVPFFFEGWGDWVPMLGQIEGVLVSKITNTTDGWVMGLAGKDASGHKLYAQSHRGIPVVAPVVQTYAEGKKA